MAKESIDARIADLSLDLNEELSKKVADLQAENTLLRKALQRMVDDARLENNRLVSRAAIIQGEKVLTQKGGE